MHLILELPASLLFHAKALLLDFPLIKHKSMPGCVFNVSDCAEYDSVIVFENRMPDGFNVKLIDLFMQWHAWNIASRPWDI